MTTTMRTFITLWESPAGSISPLNLPDPRKQHEYAVFLSVDATATIRQCRVQRMIGLSTQENQPLFRVVSWNGTMLKRFSGPRFVFHVYEHSQTEGDRLASCVLMPPVA